MPMHNDEYEIRQMPLSVKFVRQQVESFLVQNGLRLGSMDYYAAVYEHGEEEILAGGGLCGNVIKCIAVKKGLRDTKLGLTIISHLISTASSFGLHHLKIYTKPENEKMFESLGFQTIAKSEHAILQENDNSLVLFKKRLAALRRDVPSGIIIINANPFTKGHRYLIEQASKQVEHLFVMVVEEDMSRFPYSERRAMVEAGCQDLPCVTVCSTDNYAVSAVTFPTYFLKELDRATDTQIMLDLDLFVRHIAPTLNIHIRFIGSEPSDQLTQRYNELMKEYLPTQGIAVEEVPRLHQDSVYVSASSLRGYLKAHSLKKASVLAYHSTIPYLIADLACQSLQEELDLTPKPGLVDKHDNGAHTDMDYEMMNWSIKALRPFFVELVLLGWNADKVYVYDVQSIGLRAEKAMFEVTKGVNTHKGALFSLGLTIVVAAHLMRQRGNIFADDLQEGIKELASQFPQTKGTHGSEVTYKHHVIGALAHACKGYPDLFAKWLPFLQSHQQTQDALLYTLLYIMSTLDDTNVYYRKGESGAQFLKREATQMLGGFSLIGLEAMNKRFIAENISPGGCADMLSLTRLVQALIE